MEDRITAGLYLELGDLDPEPTTPRRRVDALLARPGASASRGGRTTVPAGPSCPWPSPTARPWGWPRSTTPSSPPTPAGDHGPAFRRFPRPSQGILTGAPTTGLLVVWISPRRPRRRAAARLGRLRPHPPHRRGRRPRVHPVTPYENTADADPRYMHFYELDADDPEAAYQSMAEHMAAVPSAASRTDEFKHLGRLGGGRRPGRLRQHLPPPGRDGRPGPISPVASYAHGLRPGRHPAPHVTLITLNRPERMNAMAFDVMIPLREALEEVERRQRHPGGGAHRRRRTVLLGRRPRGRRHHPQHRRSDRAPPSPSGPWSCSTTSSGPSAQMHQPVIGAINGAAIGGGFCLSVATDIRIASDAAYFRAAGHQQRAHLHRARAELPPAPCHRLLPGLRDHADRARRRRRRGRPHRPRVPGRPRPTRSSTPPTTSPPASSAFAGRASSSPSGSCGRASTPAACRPTWTTKARPSSTSGSPPRTSRRPSGPARESGPPTSGTDGRRRAPSARATPSPGCRHEGPWTG